MGQATEEVMCQADVVTGSNVEEGAAEAIERFILPR
jgi:hydroxymethylpyrimidine pyrophosphatase-like HAD family hydrolase